MATIETLDEEVAEMRGQLIRFEEYFVRNGEQHASIQVHLGEIADKLAKKFDGKDGFSARIERHGVMLTLYGLAIGAIASGLITLLVRYLSK